MKPKVKWYSTVSEKAQSLKLSSEFCTVLKPSEPDKCHTMGDINDLSNDRLCSAGVIANTPVLLGQVTVQLFFQIVTKQLAFIT